jgi:pSer/pThr/pTyr-binding forkhead associated (FHA) protein
MFKIICPHCNKENTFQNKNNIPSECSFCWESIPEYAQIIEQENNKAIAGLTLIYQINQQRIEITTLHKIILGRKHFGADVLSNILFNGKPVVSRKHCSIEFKDGNFYLLDEGSLNGTFYGVNKLKCKESPQKIEDGGIIWMGEEAFIAQINFKKEDKTELKEQEDMIKEKEDVKNIKQYRCRACGSNFEKFTDDCPNCDRYNSLIPIYD